MDAEDPRTTYTSRLEARRRALASLESRFGALSNARLVVFGLVVACAVAAFSLEWMSYAWMAIPATVFVVLVVVHERVVRLRELARRSVSFYERALARLDHAWQGLGNTRSDFVDADHLYAADLDLFGEGSLFDLLSLASTREGEVTLAEWLAGPAGVPEVRERQEAVRELGPMLDLREQMALIGGDVRTRARSETLTRWGRAPAVLSTATRSLVSALAWVLTLAALASTGLWILTDVGPLPLAVVLLVEIIVHLVLGRSVRRMVERLDRPTRELGVLARVLARLERERFSSTKLRALQDRLLAGGRAASVAIGRLRSLAGWLDARRNALFAPVGYMLMWSVHFACAIESWRARHGPRIEDWLAAVGTFEALSSLAGYAYEHPGDPFPELVQGGPLFHAEDLGHPLIRDEECVRNSVHLDADVPAWIVSGSNMSGKSTLLRACGVAAVLAQAGAPVRAGSLRLSPCALGATIRIQDSIHQGTSRFYNEIRRLKQLRDLARGPEPLLYLLDEIFHGTNSHDRQVGAAALLTELIGAGAMGLVVTHDLAIAEAAPRFDTKVKNVHFVDQLVRGELQFDYKLRDGIVDRSNAIELMRAVGLKV
jgi:hypothetical protein